VTEPERDLDQLFAELGRTEPEPRDQVAENERRRRISALIDARLAERAEGPSRAKARSSVIWRRGIWAAAAAAIIAAIGGWVIRERTPFFSLEPERTTSAGSKRDRLDDARAPTSPDPISSVGPRTVDAPARAPERGIASSARAPGPVASASGSSVTPSPSAASDEMPASLAAQNELFQSAVRAARRGDDTTALAGFDALLQRFPDSPLATDARVRKFRTLSRLGRLSEARVAASDYLARHPQGFARAEAERLQRGVTSGKETSSP
jgi:hypothetical protein